MATPLRFYQLGRLDAENFRQRGNRQQTYVHFAAFERSDCVAMKVSKLRETLL